jgi:hypothetical protein
MRYVVGHWEKLKEEEERGGGLLYILGNLNLLQSLFK